MNARKRLLILFFVDHVTGWVWSVRVQVKRSEGDKAYLLGITDGGELLDFLPTWIFMEKAVVEP